MISVMLVMQWSLVAYRFRVDEITPGTWNLDEHGEVNIRSYLYPVSSPLPRSRVKSSTL